MASKPVPHLRRGAAKAIKKSETAHSKRRKIERVRAERKSKSWRR